MLIDCQRNEADYFFMDLTTIEKSRSWRSVESIKEENCVGGKWVLMAKLLQKSMESSCGKESLLRNEGRQEFIPCTEHLKGEHKVWLRHKRWMLKPVTLAARGRSHGLSILGKIKQQRSSTNPTFETQLQQHRSCRWQDVKNKNRHSMQYCSNRHTFDEGKWVTGGLDFMCYFPS